VKKPTRDLRGFTLIEVVVATTLLFMVTGAVFYFYSNLMDRQGKIKRKYIVLRLAREFMDGFVFNHQQLPRYAPGGKSEREGFRLEWNTAPAEQAREVLYSSGLPPMAQLHRVNCRIINLESGNQVMELNFLVNIIFKPGVHK